MPETLTTVQTPVHSYAPAPSSVSQNTQKRMGDMPEELPHTLQLLWALGPSWNAWDSSYHCQNLGLSPRQMALAANQLIREGLAEKKVSTDPKRINSATRYRLTLRGQEERYYLRRSLGSRYLPVPAHLKSEHVRWREEQSLSR